MKKNIMKSKKIFGLILVFTIIFNSGFLSVCALAPPELDFHPDVDVPAFSASASDHTLLLSYGGTLSAWGRNDSGQCGISSDVPIVLEPNYIEIDAEIISVSAGAEHSLALDENGNVWAWGDNTYGQLGQEDETDTYVPQKVEGLEHIVQIAAGGYHSLALDEGGSVWAWGRNNCFQLGNEDEDSFVPKMVAGLSDITMVATKFDHNLAVEGNSALWAWGENSFGQLGQNGTVGEDAATPIEVPLGNDIEIVKIDVGRAHSLALTALGEEKTVYGWGDNTRCQLGVPGCEQTDTPVAIATEDYISNIIAGEYRTAVIYSNYSKYCGTGCYYDAEPVNGVDYSADVLDVLTQIYIGGKVIALGNTHSVSYTDSYIKVWGKSAYGQMFTEDRSEELSPAMFYLVNVAPKFTGFAKDAEKLTYEAELNFIELDPENALMENITLHSYVRGAGITSFDYTDTRHFSFNIDLSKVPDPYRTKDVFNNHSLFVTYHALKHNRTVMSEKWLMIYNIIITITPEEPITLGKEDGAKITATIENGRFISDDPANWQLIGAQSGVSVSQVELIDKNTAVITLSGKSGSVYTDNAVKLLCNAEAYAESMDRYTKTPIDLESENEIVFQKQSRRSGSGGSVTINPPIASISSGKVAPGTKLELTTEYSNGKIYYTTDGSLPTEKSTLYVEPIIIDQPMTVRYLVIVNGRESREESLIYTIEEPSFNPKSDAGHTRYIKGYADRTFKPDSAITRYEVIAALDELVEIQNPALNRKFKDVSEKCADIVARFVGAAIIDGYPDGTFKGEQGMTRAEFVKMMALILQIDSSGRKSEFEDVQGHWAEGYIADFARLGYLKGYEDGSFRPDAEITRAEFAVVVNRIIQNRNSAIENSFIDLPEDHWAKEDILKAYKADR